MKFFIKTSSRYTFYLYKLKGLKKLGEKTVTVPSNGTAWMEVEKKAYVFSQYNDSRWQYGVTVLDRKLKKEKWTEPYDEGTIQRLVKDTFIRKTSETVGDTTTETYKLFNKKGEIVTYVFSYTK